VVDPLGAVRRGLVAEAAAEEEVWEEVAEELRFDVEEESDVFFEDVLAALDLEEEEEEEEEEGGVQEEGEPHTAKKSRGPD
jgi:hypothetical protein